MVHAVLSRRRLLALLSSVSALSFQRGSPALALDPSDVSDEVAAQILYEEADPSVESLPAAKIKPFWFQQPEGERPAPNWPPDNVSFDYAHLTQFANVTEPFSFSVATLESLLALNAISRDVNKPKLLFGLRGCTLAAAGDSSPWAKEHQLRELRPNHLEPRCLIGVLDIAKGEMAVFKASTVPAIDLMQKQIEGSLGCNMLPTGFHQYVVGPHRGPRQPGAFRQQTSLWVHRTKKNLVFAANDSGNEWDDMDGNLPFDNIHAAMLSGRKRPPFFSSAGCQVVVGAYTDKRVPTGAWAEFRQAAGLAHPLEIVGTQATKDDGRLFDYVLLTGKEARLASGGETKGLRALRFGSNGSDVEALRVALAKLPEGNALAHGNRFDRATQGAVIRWQVANKIAPTGVVTTATAQQIGLQWT